MFEYLPVRELTMTHLPPPPQRLTPKRLGERVRLARKSQDLLQEDLAGVAGVGTRFIVDLEAGKPTLQLDKVLAVLETLGLTLRLAATNEAQGIQWAPGVTWTPSADITSFLVGRPSRQDKNQGSNPIDSQETPVATRSSVSRTANADMNPVAFPTNKKHKNNR